MADPFSIVSGTAGLLAVIATASVAADGLRRDFISARREITECSVELDSLADVLAELRDLYQSDPDCLSPRLNSSLRRVLRGCKRTVAELDDLLDRAATQSLARLRWSISGKKQCKDLRSNLEAHKTALSINLLMINTVKHNQVQENTDKILRWVTSLRTNIPDNDDGAALRDFLAEAASYAETVYSGSATDDGSAPAGSVAAPNVPDHAPPPPPAALPRPRRASPSRRTRTRRPGQPPLRGDGSRRVPGQTTASKSDLPTLGPAALDAPPTPARPRASTPVQSRGQTTSTTMPAGPSTPSRINLSDRFKVKKGAPLDPSETSYLSTLLVSPVLGRRAEMILEWYSASSNLPVAGTLLGFATYQGWASVVKRLLEDRGADPSAPICWSNGNEESPLGYAVSENMLDIATELVKHGADANAVHKFAFFRTTGVLGVAASKGNVDMAEMLISRGGARPNPETDDDVPLDLAIRWAKSPEMVRLLLEHGANPNRHTTGYTMYSRPLWTAISRLEEGPVQDEIMRALLQAGADPNLYPEEDHAMNALGFAALHLNVPAVRLLRENGVQVDHSSLILAAVGSSFRRIGSVIVVTELLLSWGCNVNFVAMHGVGGHWILDDFTRFPPEIRTPLQAAIYAGDPSLVLLLLDHGANPNIAIPDGAGPLLAFVLSSCMGHSRDTRTAADLRAVFTRLVAFGARIHSLDEMERLMLCAQRFGRLFAYDYEGQKRTPAVVTLHALLSTFEVLREAIPLRVKDDWIWEETRGRLKDILSPFDE